MWSESPLSYPDLENLLSQDEGALIKALSKDLKGLETSSSSIAHQAKVWIKAVRALPMGTFNIQRFMQAFPLSEPEGRSLMALAEAFLRIPDSYTAGLLLEDKLFQFDWRKGGFKEDALLKLSRWGLQIISTLQASVLEPMAQPVNLALFRAFMYFLGREFILGRTIETASKRRLKTPQDRFSFDMLGEGARTPSMAKAYKQSYAHAIEVLARQKGTGNSPYERDSISVKLSALHPHYALSHYDEVMKELLPDLIELCQRAQTAGIALTIDAEEAARLELSLDLIKAVSETKELANWDGFGLAVQAYQTRAPAVIGWVQELAEITKKPFMVRLVKGAYWDTEIKIAQVGGYSEYPVFTRKAATDLSYLACTQQLLKAKGILYPQFATHNAYTVAAVLEMAGNRTDIEFQRLQGMGEELYTVVRNSHPIAVRVYAPVGDNRDLLPYLVRRLLENGANSSFVHKIYDSKVSPEKIVEDPLMFFETHSPGKHPMIPFPKDIYGPHRENSRGYDLNDRKTLETLKAEIEKAKGEYGTHKENTLKDLNDALNQATTHQVAWDEVPASQRAEIFKRAADIIEKRRGLFLGLLIEEAGKTLPDAVAELREAMDFCRYYAIEALKHFEVPQTLPGPTGELNQLVLRGRGVFACISPWNFPLAIFMGQVTAALVAGNGVIAKPASATPLIAWHAIKVLHEAGVPKEVLHFLHGPSKVFGTPLIEDQRISGVVFTGSTSTAQSIQKILAERGGPIVPFIAETGGLNVMIVDSSALIEQVVDDVIVSAFQSAGQRCSALRILYLQDDIYDQTLAMLREAMENLTVGDPALLSTDVGPVINKEAQEQIEAYVKRHKPLARTPLPNLEGNFVAPSIIEIQGIEALSQEVFGPILHVARFKARDLDKVITAINHKGYGLTMGLESRIESTIEKVRTKARVGNLYVNRTMIGAVVGVQPFGGEGLSGTGPKAGGPHYLPRFAVERTFSYNTMASGGNVALFNLEEE
ncbi:MAG: bifunctional proline dehydrogenase/L-glutamate gamma-semialdehyde dehydrogenase PutA [Alphaproteobacteria bacterium]|nr:bifunctional proline dehydrogenase/L-glutamate gamma-semialdehyde dehydrogenase PutA [Alphaproteobacteria bacterium]